MPNILSCGYLIYLAYYFHLAITPWGPIRVTLHPRTIFHVCQIFVHWDPLKVKQGCPQNFLVWAM